MSLSVSRLLAALSILVVASLAAMAPVRADEGCPGLVARRSLPIVPVAATDDTVQLTFVGHATFLIESPSGLKIATDYNDYVRPSVMPDVITMNHAHSTHYTNHPPPEIGTVLRGWNPDGGLAPRYDVRISDVRIRNVVTNIRQWGTEETTFEGNSIFVFETADLCIAHLGHLHHTLTPEHLRQLGRIDVVLVPIDGSYTLDITGMMEVLRAIGARVMIPMHFFGPSTLNRFLDLAAGEGWAVVRNGTATVSLSRASLVGKPEVLVLSGF